MVKFVALIMLSLAAANAQTTVKQCKGSRKLDSSEVSLSNCQKGICKLYRGKSTEINLKFTPDKDIKSLSTNVEANINGIQIPWIGVDGVSACNSIFTEDGEKAPCPLKQGQRYIYRNKFDVLAIYPRIQTVVHWGLKSGGSNVACFEVPVRIV